MPSQQLLVGALLLSKLLTQGLGYAGGDTRHIEDARPPPANRTFNSSLVNLVVDKVGLEILQQPLGTLFRNCLPNTLDTTVLQAGPVPSMTGDIWDAFVITGDINAMWLRDSMNQVLPYIRLLNASESIGREELELRHLLFGTLHRQMSSILVDPYSNAFAWCGPGGQRGAVDDITFAELEYGAGPVNAMQNPRIFERKYELDSLVSPLKLAAGLHEILPDEAAEHFLADPMFVPATSRILDTLEEMSSCSSTAYSFQRQTTQPTDTLSHGVGFPCRDTGMVRQHFRPSDDAVIYNFNIPGNAMAAVELSRFQKVLVTMMAAQERSPKLKYPWANSLNTLAVRAKGLEASIRTGISTHGTMTFNGTRVYAYEVDGFGNAVFMDDANVPSLLSLPLLGFVSVDDALYQATRKQILSPNNPWYFKGKLDIGGTGGPHIGAGAVWPMSLIVQGLTSRDVGEVSTLLQQLMVASAPNSYMHESFNQDSLQKFTRPWFAWANTLFGEFVLRVATDPVLYKAANLTQPLDLARVLRDAHAEDVARPTTLRV